MARPRGRHSRRTKRLTPRRWLPFVVLVAVITVGVVVQDQTTESGPNPVAVTSAAARIPVAAESDAISTAWYCAGGTATGSGAAELTVVIANAHDLGATAEVTAISDDGRRRRTTLMVPANGRTRVVASEILKADWIGLTIEVFGGLATVEREVSGPTGIDASPCSTNAAATWFVPSGSTVREAKEYLTLFNPFPDATSVDITFATDDGAKNPRSLRGYVVPARSLRVVAVGNSLPARKEIAAKIKARTGRIVVDRVQIYSGKGDPVPAGDSGVATPAPQGLASTAAFPATSDRWRFPHGRKDPDTRTQLAIYNPGNRFARVDVSIGFENPNRHARVEPMQLDIRAGEETVLDLTSLGTIAEGVPFSIDVHSIDAVPVVAEQLVFGAAARGPVAGFSAVAGSPVAAGSWFMASRGQTKIHDASVVVVNPGSATVTVTVKAIVAGTRSKVTGATVKVPAGDRRVLDLSGAPMNPALLVSATGPIVVGHLVVVPGGDGLSQSLATPLPETVVELPKT